MENFRERKAKIRNEALARRNQIPADTRSTLSHTIKKHFLAFDIPPNAIISAFLPIRSEVNLKPLIDTLWQKNHRICLPVMLENKTIEFRQYDKDTELTDNGFGTHAPDKHSPCLTPDIMLIPLSAYDETGHRIGYGAGYYDKAIARLYSIDKKPLLIGVAFAVQKVDKICFEAHDMPLDIVLTEQGLHIPARAHIEAL